MAALELTEWSVSSHATKTLTYHDDQTAGAQIKLEFGEDELSEVVPAGKVWNVQATLVITEVDA